MYWIWSVKDGLVTLHQGAGWQHWARSKTFWASCIMLFVPSLRRWPSWQEQHTASESQKGCLHLWGGGGGREALVREVFWLVALAELQRSCVEKGETSRRATITATLHRSGLSGRVARWKPLLSEGHRKASVEFATTTTTTQTPKELSVCEEQDSLVWWNQDWTVWPQL